MQKKEDVNKYNTNTGYIPSERVEGEFSRTVGATAKTIGGMFLKLLKTVFFILAITGLLVFISVASFILSLRDSAPPDLSVMNLDYSSFIKVKDTNTGEFVDYMTLPAPSENRVWAYMDDLNAYVMDAMVAIEDKRFYEHNGVDWYTTMGAVYKLASSSDGGGGSTITQQLVKNLTKQDQVSVVRKITEIFKAMNMEENYSKDEILLTYLNVVNFGGRNNGVQAAAHYYFGKDIKNCDLAETAAIVGITQYPYLYNPYNDKEENKNRQQTVLTAMHDQGYITQAEYKEAMEKSKSMVFVGELVSEEDDNNTDKAWNWYVEETVRNSVSDIAEYYGWDNSVASTKLYTGGFTIYSSMNVQLQEAVEALFQNPDNQPADPEIQYGISLMDYYGKLIAIVGSREPKTANRLENYAVTTNRATGSSIKPLSVYGPALEAGLITYGTVLEDKAIKGYPSEGQSGPSNFSGEYEDYMNVDTAVEISQNAPVVYLLDKLGVETSFNFLVDKLHFAGLVSEDMNRGPLALGGFTYGASVLEMTAGFQIFGNGGVYNKPYTYEYITDHDGNVILDNRNKTGEQVLKPENAAVMNKLLRNVVYGYNGTARQVQIDGLDIYGKTGTTDDEYDLWFVGGTPFGVAGVWNGYADRQVRLDDSTTAKVMWRTLMSYLYNNYNFADSGYKVSDNITQEVFCRSSGLLAGDNCFNTSRGWYANIEGGYPDRCDGGSDHTKNGAPVASPSPSPSPSAVPSPSPELSPTPGLPTETPPVEPTPEPPTPEPTPVPTPEPTPVPTPEPTPVPTPEPTPDNSSGAAG